MVKVSLHGGAYVSQAHNLRERVTSNPDIHPERMKDNIVLFHEDAQEAYSKLFDQVIRDYNDKQKRSDRKLDYDGKGYFEKMKSKTFKTTTKDGEKENRQYPYYEYIVQVGSIEDPVSEEEAVKIYKEFFDNWKKNYDRHLHVIGAYIHRDEGTAHMHIDYIPIAEMRKGMKQQVSLKKAFEQLTNYTSKNKFDNAQIFFQDKQREFLRQRCFKHGIYVDEIHHSKEKHLQPNEYKFKILEQKIEELARREYEVYQRELDNEERERFFENLYDGDQAKKPESLKENKITGKVTMSKSDYDNLMVATKFTSKMRRAYNKMSRENDRYERLNDEEFYAKREQRLQEMKDQYDELSRDYNETLTTNRALKRENNTLEEVNRAMMGYANSRDYIEMQNIAAYDMAVKKVRKKHPELEKELMDTYKECKIEVDKNYQDELLQSLGRKSRGMRM